MQVNFYTASYDICSSAKWTKKINEQPNDSGKPTNLEETSWMHARKKTQIKTKKGSYCVNAAPKLLKPSQKKLASNEKSERNWIYYVDAKPPEKVDTFLLIFIFLRWHFVCIYLKNTHRFTVRTHLTCRIGRFSRNNTDFSFHFDALVKTFYGPFGIIYNIFGFISTTSRGEFFSFHFRLLLLLLFDSLHISHSDRAAWHIELFV